MPCFLPSRFCIADLWFALHSDVHWHGEREHGGRLLVVMVTMAELSTLGCVARMATARLDVHGFCMAMRGCAGFEDCPVMGARTRRRRPWKGRGGRSPPGRVDGGARYWNGGGARSGVRGHHAGSDPRSGRGAQVPGAAGRTGTWRAAMTTNGISWSGQEAGRACSLYGERDGNVRTARRARMTGEDGSGRITRARRQLRPKVLGCLTKATSSG